MTCSRLADGRPHCRPRRAGPGLRTSPKPSGSCRGQPEPILFNARDTSSSELPRRIDAGPAPCRTDRTGHSSLAPGFPPSFCGPSPAPFPLKCRAQRRSHTGCLSARAPSPIRARDPAPGATLQRSCEHVAAEGQNWLRRAYRLRPRWADLMGWPIAAAATDNPR